MTSSLPAAMVLTAGLGTRLSPLSDVRAKPAVPVARVPLILRILRWLGGQGIQSVVLNLHHKPESITAVVGHGEDAGVRVRYSWERQILGSAGGPRRALSLLGSRFFVINGDTLTTANLSELLKTHERTGADVTLGVTENPDPSRYGGVVVDPTGLVVGFQGAGAPSQHFVGVQLVEAAVFEHLPENEPAATIGGLYDTMVATGRGRIATHRERAEFYDVGTPSDYFATSLNIGLAEGHDTPPVGERVRIDPGAQLTRTIVWDDVSIAEGCRLTDCIVADGVRLRANTVCDQMVIVATRDEPVFVPLHTPAVSS